MSVHGHYFVSKSHSGFSELRAHILLPVSCGFPLTHFLLGKKTKQTTAKQKTHCFLPEGFLQGFTEDFLKDMCGCICLLLMYILWYHHSCPLDCQHGGNPALFCVCRFTTSFKVKYLFLSFNHFFSID